MSDLIGRITVPVIAPSGQTFPLKVRWPHGRALARPVVVHPIGSGNAKIEQRYYLGTPAPRYTFQSQLNRTERNALRDMWEDMQGCIGSFVYGVPQEDGSTVNKNVCYENAPLSFEEMASTITTVGLTFVELVDPASAPTYALASTDTRFPGSTLTAALLAQVQEIIPLVKIRVLDGAVSDIFLSDRRVTIGSQLYLPRLLRVGEQGSDVLISQSIPTDGNVPADDASFTFGNADRVMSQCANDTNLQWARIELSFFHVGTGIKIDLWAGYLIDWHFDKGPEFSVKASDILSALARSSPPGTVSRQCARRYGLDGCPAVPGSQAMDTTHFPTSSNATCDLGYNTPNGCMAHQVQESYAAIFASPQGVIILDKSSEGGGRLIRPTSIVSDTIYGDTLPEIYHDDEGVSQYGLPVKCKVAAGRDESDYYIALGLIGKGPLGALTAPQMWDQDGNGTPETFVGSTLDGQPNHGFQVDSTGHLKPGSNATFGLRSGLGSDPAGANDYFSLGRVSSGIGLGAPRGWFTNPDGSPMNEVGYSGSAYNKVFAAGIAFLEIRRTDQGGIQPSLPSSHDMLAVVSQGLSGYTWSAPGTRVLTGAITDPFWVTVNTYLRALGLFGASRATQELYFDVAAAVASAVVASTVVARIFGAGTEKQFQFKGVLDQRRPTRDWLQFVLNNAAGFYTWSFGRLKVGCRYNASVASAFTAGNMIWNSLTVEPTKPRFEKLTVKFNDQEYLYAANTVDYVDQAYAVRNARWPAPLASDLDLPGTVTKSQAGRLAVIRAREELGGVTQAEQDAARLAAWRTTLLALETEAGQVVSVTDDDFPGGVGKLRILSWRLNRDYSIDITGKTVTASMYDLTTGPKPTDVAASPIPGEGPAVWDPNYETPITNDPIFASKSFGVRPVYEPDAGNVIHASVDMFGDAPADLSLFFKARREFVSGIFAQVAAAVTTVDATHGTIALGGSGLVANDYVGRVFSKLANVPGSTSLLPIQDFTVTANDTAGTFTVTPDPAAAGCVAGELFTLRMMPTAVSSTSFTDAKLINPYNTGGLTTTDGGNAGNLALVIAGTGAGQSPRTVAANTATTVTITPAWAVTPDATSVIVLVEAASQVSLSPDFNRGASDHFIGNFPVMNYDGEVVRLEGYTAQGAAEGRLEKAAFRELYLWGAASPGGTSAPLPIATVVGRDLGHGSDQQFDHITRLVTFEFGVACTFTSVPTQGCTVYLNRSGSLWTWIGSRLWTASGQENTFTTPRPPTSETWTVACVPGVIEGDPNAPLLFSGLPAGRVSSASFAVAGLALPPATLSTSPTQDAGAGGNWPYNMTTPDRAQYFEVTNIAIACAAAYLDTNTSAVVTTVEDLDVSHSPVGPEHIYSGVTPINGSMNLGKLDGSYGTDGFSYTRSGNIAFIRRRQYAVNRVDQSTAAWANPAASTLQTDVGGGLGYIDIPIAAGGVPPASEVVDTGLVGSFAFSSFFDPGFEQATPGLVIDPAGALFGPGYLGSAVWLYQVPAPGVLTIYASGGHNGGQYVGMKAASVRVGQLLTTTGGASHFFSVWAKSTNNASVNHLLQFQAEWIDGSGAAISTTTVTLLTQYIPSWSFISGFVTAPAGAALVTFYFGTGASEPSTDEWYIDDLFVQGTIDQSANNQTTTTAPAAGASDYSALRALSTIDSSGSYYGRLAFSVTAADGSELLGLIGTGGGGIEATTPSDVHHIGIFATTGAGGPTIQLRKSSVSYAGQDLTFQDNAGVNHQVIAGVIVS